MSRVLAGQGVEATAPAQPESGRRIAKNYLDRSALPLTSLFFIFPWLIVYEVGTRWWAVDPVSHTEHRIIAFSKIQEFFRFFKLSGDLLPALTVVGVLLAWHIARNDAWTVNVSTILWMLVESLALALPLCAISYAFAHYLPLMNGVGINWQGKFVLSIGAGIYEELVFRLGLVTLLHLIFIDIFGMKGFWAGLFIVVVSSVGFSAYHYLGDEVFAWPTFAFRTVAGVYFAVVFMTRSFGITAGCHGAYDVIVHALQYVR